MTLILVLIKASIVLSVVGVTQALLGRRASAATRHLIWALTIVGLLLLPMLSLVLPGWTVLYLPATTTPVPAVSLPPSESYHAAVSTGSTGASEPIIAAGPAPRLVGRAGTSWAMALIVLYAIGLLVLLARLTGERWAIRRLTRHATPVTDPDWTHLLHECAARIGVRRTVSVLRSCEHTMPVAVGIWRNVILVPAVADTWSDDRRRAVLLHELAHVVRCDCLTQLLAALVCGLYWIHPGVWWVARRLRLEREIACDDMVLSTGTDARDYAAHLLDLAFALRGHRTTALAVGMAGPRQLEQRMLAVLDAARSRGTRRLQASLGMAMMAALLVTVAAATTAASGQSSPNAPAQDDAGFVAELLKRGYERPTPDEQRQLARRDIGLTFLDELMAQGYTQPSLAELVRAAQHGVSLEYLREMGQLGYRFQLLDALIVQRDHGVSPSFVRALRAEGVTPAADELTRARDHGVSPEYVSELRQLGFPGLSLDVLVRTRDHGVSGEYIRALSQLGYKPSLDDIIKARDHGISPEYVNELRELGFAGLSLDTLIRARDHGVSSEYVRDLAQLGYRPSLDGLIRARDHGVSAEYIRELTALGYKDLSLDDLIRLRDHGVTAQFVSELTTAGNSRPTLDELIAWRSSDPLRNTIDRMLGVNVRQFVWHVRCAAAWLQQVLNGATLATC